MTGGKGSLNIIIAVILAILGIVLIIQNIVQNRRYNNIRNWFLTNAIVVNAVAQPVTSSAGFVPVDPNNITLIADATARFIPQVIYRYNVNGIEFESNQLFYGKEQQLSSSEITNFMDKFRVGSTIPIYYNPSNPRESYVIVSGGQNYWGIIFGIILVILAFWVMNRNRIKISSSGIDIMSETPNLTEMGPVQIPGTIGRLY